ncbi:HNH endonuclease [Rhizobium laguerreae]|uniref:HNH endonuclease n=1 Tax=Rhizobium laguerreae TaxID=1076926 RepID=UPI00143F8066|nr:HNH endonuclease [Rhizobium laguerreae]NKM86345.1 HNH endonuclease [Rhizobium laguerreae]
MSTKAKPITVSHERLLTLFHYDPETGVFTRLVTTRGRAQAGAVAGSPHGAGYLRISIDHQDYLAHRLAWFYMTGEDVPEGYEIDHENTVPSDNRWQNLRLATSSQNKCNAIRKGRTLPKGVSLHAESGRYIAQITIRGEAVFLGRFDSPLDAAKAYAFAANDLHGQFARAA